MSGEKCNWVVFTNLTGLVLVFHGKKSFKFVAKYLIIYIKQEDYRKITVERKGETNFFTSQVCELGHWAIVTLWGDFECWQYINFDV